MLLLCALVAGSSSVWADETLTIDFEEASYSDWTLTTILSKQTNSGVPAHGGSCYGGTDGKEKGSVVTNEKIASPQSITFYVSKETTNTNANSKWIVKVSSDGSEWTEVGDKQDAGANIIKGEWTEVTRDLSSYSDVYVGVFYDGTTAKRCIDDITITYEESTDPSVTTTITIDDSGITNTNVFEGTAAGKLAATVMAGETAVSGATVTWESSKTDVATIAQDGTVTLVAAGSTVITASYAGVENQYKSSSKEYTLTVTNVDPDIPGTEVTPYTVAQARAAIDADDGVTGVYAKGIVSEIVTAYNSQYGNITYNISTDGLKTSEQLQAYRGKGINGAKFTSNDDIQVGDEVVIYGDLTKHGDTYEFAQDNQLVSLKRQEKNDTQLLLEDDFSMEVSATKLVNDLYETDSDGEVTVTSSKTDVITIEDGKLVAVAKGTSVITISIAASETFKSASGQINVTVTVKDAVQPEGASAGGFTLVTDVSTLKAGDKLLIVNQDGDQAIGTDASKNNRPAASVTVDNGTIAEIGADVQIITLEGEAGAWYFNVGDDAYLYASSNSSNQLKTASLETAGNNGKATITIDESNIATILFQGTNGRNDMRFNPNNGSPIFSCYASTNTTMAKPQIYRQDAASTFDITVSDAGWRTLVTSQDVTLPEGLTAYVVTTSDDAKATLQEVSSIKANNPYILNGAKGTYTLTVADGVEAPAANLLQISTESTGNGVYVLAQPDGKEVGFYKWNGGSLGAGRVYLPAPAATAPEFLSFVFGSETTGVKAIENGQWSTGNAVYNLAGQRVANPTKGLYIVNGKKVIIK